MGTNDILENIIGLRSPDEEFRILIDALRRTP